MFLNVSFIKDALCNNNMTDTASSIENGFFAPNETIKDGNITVYNYDMLNISLISVPDTLYYVLIPKDAAKFNSVALENNFRYQINASYFAGSAKDASHCGLLKIYNSVIDSSLIEDKQLKYIASFNKAEHKINFFYYKDFVSQNDPNTLDFQTGPLIVQNNKLAEEAIKSSINWKRKAQRTLIASLDNKEIFLVVVRKKTGLIELGNALLKLSVFKNKKLDVMNLDGGSSTALYSRNFPKLDYNSNAQLPLLIGIK